MSDDATLAQVDAAQPFESTWLSANAGSGKTRVLTNRVARLLLKGANPQNILCLTYTKAAASEMQNRLFGTLGAWAMLADDKLRAELTELGEVPPADLSNARTLFARAIETPGGLKIQTIHSLCASILRQFPMEGKVSPQFRELDERGRDALISEVLEGLANTGPECLAQVASFYSGDGLVALAKDVVSKSRAFSLGRDRDDIFRAFGVSPGCSYDQVIDQTFEDGDLEFLRGLVPVLVQGSTNDQKLGMQLASLPQDPSIGALDVLSKVFLFQSGANAHTAKIGSLPTKATRGIPEFQADLPLLETIMERVERGFHMRRDFEAAWKTAALHDFAHAFLPAYQDAKQDKGLVDFDDLIHRTREVLSSPALSWVLFRLDGRIDHILVDEAQDTSPDQWAVIRALTEELASAGDGGRTLFVVGDKKQSIYSFQGADASGFDRHEIEFNEKLGNTLRPRKLLYSFRSSPAILRVVDAVIDAAEGGLGDSGDHKAFHGDMPGRVDLLPLIAPPEAQAETPWYHPTDRPVDNAPPVVLGQKVASMISEMLEKGTIPTEKGNSRAILPGDIMILVQRRSQVFDQIIQACKTANLPVAGADVLKIGAELAVRDLLALLSVLTLPEDDLSLAAVLRSPIFGWSEQDLYRLAQPRDKKATLWDELQRRGGDFPPAIEVLRSLRGKVDYLRPFELLDLILGRFGVRRKLLARLGPEAEDGIDELLSQALAYERDAVPSVTGFLTRAQAENVEVKRQPDTADTLIRVMTVHGAKGLERPVVILPDTTGIGGRQSQKVLVDEAGLAMLALNDEQCPPSMAAVKDAKKAADRHERNRLLYVAMTRAEKWLVVCGVKPGRESKEATSWHDAVADAMERLGAKPIPGQPDALRIEHGAWPQVAERGRVESPKLLDVPDFLSRSAVRAALRQTPISPSDLGGAKVIGGGAREEEQAKLRGRQIHLLLEHLPGAKAPEDAARRLLSHGSDRADPSEIAELTNEALRNLSLHPALFSDDALAEVEISANLPSLGRPILGKIDRLIVGPELVQAIDFKTNANVPVTADDVPEGILRQMGAYLEALTQIYSKQRIEVSVLWTGTCQLMPLPHAIVRAALGRSTIS